MIHDLIARALHVFEPETAHRFGLLGLKAGLGPRQLRRDHPMLATRIAGLDLPNVDLSATRDGPRLTITSVTGTILSGTLFKNGDLTALDPALVDLTDVDVWDDSICPDGLPPDDPTIGKCVGGRRTPH